MKVIYKKHGEGKTTDLIKMSHETQTYILCANRQRAENIARMARQMGINIFYPITLGEYMQGHAAGSFVRRILIDDADYCLQLLLPWTQIDAITITENED